MKFRPTRYTMCSNTLWDAEYLTQDAKSLTFEFIRYCKVKYGCSTFISNNTMLRRLRWGKLRYLAALKQLTINYLIKRQQTRAGRKQAGAITYLNLDHPLLTFNPAIRSHKKKASSFTVTRQMQDAAEEHYNKWRLSRYKKPIFISNQRDTKVEVKDITRNNEELTNANGNSKQSPTLSSEVRNATHLR